MLKVEISFGVSTFFRNFAPRNLSNSARVIKYQLEYDKKIENR